MCVTTEPSVYSCLKPCSFETGLDTGDSSFTTYLFSTHFPLLPRSNKTLNSQFSQDDNPSVITNRGCRPPVSRNFCSPPLGDFKPCFFIKSVHVDPLFLTFHYFPDFYVKTILPSFPIGYPVLSHVPSRGFTRTTFGTPRLSVRSWSKRKRYFLGTLDLIPRYQPKRRKFFPVLFVFFFIFFKSFTIYSFPLSSGEGCIYLFIYLFS